MTTNRLVQFLMMSIYDYEDSNNVDFVMSSVQQDVEMKLFTDWLESIDGGKKSPREAQKHRSTVLQALRYDPDIIRLSLKHLLIIIM